MEHPNAAPIRRLHKARDRNDEDAFRCVLSEGVLWYEPDGLRLALVRRRA